MKRLKINRREAESLFSGLSRDYRVIAPVEKTGKGRLSNTNLVTYDEVNGFDEIEFFKKTYYSAKEVLFPIRQTLFEYEGRGKDAVKEDFSPAIIFLRACDINAISVMDYHFLKKDDCEDIYYKKRREKVLFFLMECKSPFKNCFCVSCGTNRTEDYAVFIRKEEDGYEVKVKEGLLEKYFPAGIEKEVEPRFVEKDLNPVTLPEEIDVSIFEDKMWREYSLRCSACGRCNTSCPTCSCFTIQDIPLEDNEKVWQKRRIWSSCQVKNFALLAGNHDFRIPNGDRMRYKVLHKIRDFRKRSGFNMCVGCGRCDEACPEYISMFKCIEKINEAQTYGTK